MHLAIKFDIVILSWLGQLKELFILGKLGKAEQLFSHKKTPTQKMEIAGNLNSDHKLFWGRTKR